MVAGVLLTKMDTFLTRAEYEQLVYLACAPTRRQDVMASSPPLLPPTILKPHRLWTGKQVGPSPRPAFLWNELMFSVRPHAFVCVFVLAALWATTTRSMAVRHPVAKERANTQLDRPTY